MNRCLQLMTVAALSCVVLGGCGSNPNTIRAGYVTGPDGTDGSAEAEAITSGIESYAAESSVQTRVYTASADTEEAYAVQFDAAAEDGTSYVIASGENMEVPVYAAQNKHTKQKFLFLDGQPRESREYEATIRKNTECVKFSAADMGFITGYAAVRDGIRNVFYLGSTKEGEHLEAYNGFLSGVQYALDEQSLSSTMMTVSAEFAGSDELSPLRLSDALRAFDSGAELIVTDGQNLARAAGEAAVSRGAAVATIGFDGREISSGVLYGAVPDRAGAVEYLLTAFDADSSAFKGGSLVTLGAAEHAVMLAVDYAMFGSFTESGLQSIIDAIADGTVTVYKPAAGDGTESGAGDPNAEAPHAFPVGEVAPVTPNANSGLGDAAAVTAETDASAEAAGTDETAAAEDAPVEEAEEDTGDAEDTGDTE